ncbi:hypothetical protein [Marinomonas sp. ef1]|uniref:hypothetical protein n=1 Tax=Marinomonas sp. ef1 TaxID=2005043 RepID=UPI000C2824CF|nr:hypothetical protein [Marinomonas sp. ef1]
MFNTAKNTIKKTAKDQVEFVGAILTGAFSGSIFTLAYVKFWKEGDVTFADIGGMLAGVGTVGLLFVAWRTADNWKKQQSDSNRHQKLDAFFDHCATSLEDLRSYCLNCMMRHQLKLQIDLDQDIDSKMKKQEEYNNSLPKLTERLDKYLQSETQLKKIAIKLETEFNQAKLANEILKSYQDTLMLVVVLPETENSNYKNFNFHEHFKQLENMYLKVYSKLNSTLR